MFTSLRGGVGALVDRLAQNLDPAGNAKPGLVAAVLGDISALAKGIRGART